MNLAIETDMYTILFEVIYISALEMANICLLRQRLSLHHHELTKVLLSVKETATFGKYSKDRS